jgi:Protein of unknown function (DUF2721)
MNAQVLDIIGIGQVIQGAIAPVFLITGVASLLNVLSNRLSRVIDRARALERAIRMSNQNDPPASLEAERKLLFKRSRMINLSFSLAASCALSVCLVVILLFYSHVQSVNLSQQISFLFMGSMCLLFGSLLAILREVFLTSRSVGKGLGMTHLDVNFPLTSVPRQNECSMAPAVATRTS